MRSIVVVLVLLLLAGCASSRVEVTHRRIANEVYSVAARGDEDASEAETERSMFQRAAQLTKDAGYRYFTMIVSNLAEIMGECEVAGVAIAVPLTEIRPGVSIGMVEDPDGNWVEFVEQT